MWVQSKCLKMVDVTNKICLAMLPEVLKTTSSLACVATRLFATKVDHFINFSHVIFRKIKLACYKNRSSKNSSI